MSSELQVEIDDVYACRGSCPGCVLLPIERRVRRPDMDGATLELTMTRLADYVATLEGLDSVNILFGIADHLLMEEGYVRHIIHSAAGVIRDMSLAGSVFLTTSLVGEASEVRRRLERLAVMGDDVPLVPAVVLDPTRLAAKRSGEAYAANIRAARELFGRVDLTVTLGTEAVRQLKPRGLHDFAANAGIGDVTLNWTPTTANRYHTCGDMTALAAWLVEFDDRVTAQMNIRCGLRPVIVRTIRAVTEAFGRPDSWNVADVAESFLSKTVSKSIQIDHEGHLLAKFEAVGDVAHGERFGYRPLGNLREGSIADLIADGMPVLKRRVIAAHACNRACNECGFTGFCAATGFHVYNHLLGCADGDGGCPHVARTLWEHFAEEAGDAGPQ